MASQIPVLRGRSLEHEGEKGRVMLHTPTFPSCTAPFSPPLLGESCLDTGHGAGAGLSTRTRAGEVVGRGWPDGLGACVLVVRTEPLLFGPLMA